MREPQLGQILARLTEQHFSRYPPTAEAILAFARSTPEPPRKAIVEHIGDLLHRSLLGRADKAELIRHFPELVPVQ